jgi:uncharacterized protein
LALGPTDGSSRGSADGWCGKTFIQSDQGLGLFDRLLRHFDRSFISIGHPSAIELGAMIKPTLEPRPLDISHAVDPVGTLPYGNHMSVIPRDGIRTVESQASCGLDARRLDFLDGGRLFDGCQILTTPSPSGGEERWIGVGVLNHEMIAVAWTRRSSTIRIITMKKARGEEKRRYRALHDQ